MFADEHIESCNSPGAPPEFRVPISVKHKPVAGRQPISSIKNSICLSKSTDINLHDFRLPPKTPSSARSRAWKPGSGFKGMTKAKSIKKSAAPNLRNQDKTSDLTQEVGQGRHKASGEHQEGGFLACRKSLLATEPPNVSMPGIDPPNRAYSVTTSTETSLGHISDFSASHPMLQPGRIGQSHNGRQVGFHGAASSRPSTHDDHTLGDLPISDPPQGNDISPVASTIYPCLSDRNMGRFTFSKRGLSFSSSPMHQVKGNLDLSISSRLKRMASLPFVSPLK